MRLNVGHYVLDTRHLTRSEHGAYLLLLMSMWSAGGRLAADDAQLAKLALCTPDEWAEMRATIMRFFTKRGRSISQKRLTAELAHARDVIEERRKAGAAGGKASGRKRRQIAEAKAKQSPSKSSRSKSRHTETKDSYGGTQRGSSVKEARDPNVAGRDAPATGRAVPLRLLDAVAAATSSAFVGACLCGATMDGDVLRPSTFYAHDMLAKDRAAGAVLEANGITLGAAVPLAERPIRQGKGL
jgi:uncharacterized protein YdaU (DUF1376 family)